MAYTFFENYHQAAKDYANGDLQIYGRLLMIINTYAIEGELITDLNPVEKLFFTSVKASIDKSLEMREKGQKGGKSNKKPRFKAQENPAFNEEEREIENEIEYECEIEREDKSEITDKDLIKISLDNDLFLNSSFLTPAFIKRINDRFSDPKAAAQQRLEYVLQNYPTKDNDGKAAMFIKSFSWDIPVVQKQKPEKKEKPKEKELNPPPKKCPVCNSKLIRNGLDQVICGHCREHGKLVWWEKEDGEWKRQDTETA